MKTMVLAEIDGHLTITAFRRREGYGFDLTRTDYGDSTHVALIYDGVDRGAGEAAAYAELFARTPGMLRLLQQALAEHGDAFDADEPVPGADLVEWYVSWRLEVRELLTQPLPQAAPAPDPDP